MKITKVKLENYGRFKNLELPLATTETIQSNTTVIVGNNGAGKTTVLSALAISLNWLIARLRREKGTTATIPESLIKNGTSESSITTYFSHPELDGKTVGVIAPESSWQIVKTREGKKKDANSDLILLSELANHYRVTYTDDDKASLPLICYYSVDRGVLDVPVRSKKVSEYSQFDAYDEKFTSGLDFRKFFEWFRFREDLENEQVMPPSALENIKHHMSDEAFQLLLDEQVKQKDRQLQAVRHAINIFMPEYTNIQIKRNEVA